MMYICTNCHELTEKEECPICGTINSFQNDEAFNENVRNAIRYGYSYRKLAQLNDNGSDRKLQLCIPEASEYLIILGKIILSGFAWDTIKIIVSKIYDKFKDLIKKNKDKEAELIFSDDEELYKFYMYLTEYQNGFINISDQEYKYIKEEMFADFCAKELSIITEEKGLNIAIEEYSKIVKKAIIKIETISKRPKSE